MFLPGCNDLGITVISGAVYLNGLGAILYLLHFDAVAGRRGFIVYFLHLTHFLVTHSGKVSRSDSK